MLQVGSSYTTWLKPFYCTKELPIVFIDKNNMQYATTLKSSIWHKIQNPTIITFKLDNFSEGKYHITILSIHSDDGEIQQTFIENFVN